MGETKHLLVSRVEGKTNHRRSHLPIEAKRVQQAFHIFDTIRSERSNVLRPGQFEVFGEIIKHLLIGNKAGYIELPTGAGKTVIASWLIELLGENAIIIAPTNETVEQFERAIHNFTNITPIQSKNIDETKLVELRNSVGKHVVVTTHDNFRAKKQLGEQQLSDEEIESQYPFLLQYPPDKYPILIIDEAQKCIGPESLKALRKYLEQRGIQVYALTATPDFNKLFLFPNRSAKAPVGNSSKTIAIA